MGNKKPKNVPLLEQLENISSISCSVATSKSMSGKIYIRRKADNSSMGYIYETTTGFSWRPFRGTKNDRIYKFSNVKELVSAVEKGKSSLIKIDTKPKVINKSKKQTVSVKQEEVKNEIKEQTKTTKQYTSTGKELIPSMFKYYMRTDKLNNVKTLETALDNEENVLIEGSTGSGKTTMVRYYCAKHKLPYKRVSLNGGATAEDLIGHYILESNGDGKVKTIWVDGVLPRAMKEGWVLVIDEINGAPAEILFVLNPVLDDERTLVLSQKDGEVVKPHPNFRVVATCNPTEQGYAGTNEINEALRDRFSTTLKVEYNESVENRIIKELGVSESVRKDITDFTKYVRESYIKSEIITPFSTRSVINLTKFIQAGNPNLILNRFRDSERAVISDLLDVFIHKNKTIEELTGETVEDN